MTTATATKPNKPAANPALNAAEKINCAAWKLHTVIATLANQNTHPSSFAARINADIQLGTVVGEDMIISAYNSCFTGKDALQKLINRLGYFRFELLTLIVLFKDKQPDLELYNDLITALNFIPTKPKDYGICEINLRKAIHSLMPDEEAVAKTNLYGKHLRVIKGELSNHVFNLVRLGRTTMADINERIVIEKLISNQLTLLNKLPLGIKIESGSDYQRKQQRHKIIDLENRMLKLSHWQPHSAEDAVKTLTETQEVLELV